MNQRSQMFSFRGRKILLLFEPPLQLIHLKRNFKITSYIHRNRHEREIFAQKNSTPTVCVRQIYREIFKFTLTLNSIAINEMGRAHTVWGGISKFIPVLAWREPAFFSFEPGEIAWVSSQSLRTRPNQAFRRSSRDPCLLMQLLCPSILIL